MYEYRCTNEACNKIWTIREGEINCYYLTCPFCKKGRGTYIRQIKEGLNGDINKEGLNGDIKELVPKKNDENYKTLKQIENSDNEVPKKVEKERPKKKQLKEEIIVKNTEKEVITNQEDEQEEDIFERIIKKRQEAELNKEPYNQNEIHEEKEEIDILEISGSSIEEIESRIKEFEEYFYIKVIEKKLEQQGRRYNCTIKYYRK